MAKNISAKCKWGGKKQHAQGGACMYAGPVAELYLEPPDKWSKRKHYICTVELVMERKMVDKPIKAKNLTEARRRCVAFAKDHLEAL